MADEIGFTYVIKEYYEYGALQTGKNGTKKWSGLVGAVESGEADFAVSVKGYIFLKFSPITKFKNPESYDRYPTA